MAGRLDWAVLTRLAIESHATTGLWDVVSRFPDLPDEAETLQSLAVLNDFRRYHIRSLVARVAKELRVVGIEVLALKGAALLSGGVARPALRTMSDIDLLVVKGSPEEAWRVCQSNGWTLLDEAWTESSIALITTFRRCSIQMALRWDWNCIGACWLGSIDLGST
jgi:hypothetical protein